MPVYGVVVCPACNEGVIFVCQHGGKTTECRFCSKKIELKDRQLLYKGESITEARKIVLKMKLFSGNKNRDAECIKQEMAEGSDYTKGHFKNPYSGNNIKRCCDRIISLLKEKKTVSADELINDLVNSGFLSQEIEKSLRKLEEEGVIYNPRPEVYGIIE
ncbi:MAG: hypothetical protein QW728_03080 [Thermoplasmata archaeon]